tara:strand:+ start:295 stop:570 length:276 start_codon:yes stop_codon:yes gene_type:complete
MILNLIQLLIHILFYILIIYSFHLGWEFIKDNYSVQKKRDLISNQTSKYKQMMNDMQKNINLKEHNDKHDNNFEKLNDELENFIEEELNNQ